ncbi:MAG: hypothetical protein U0Y68_09105 [Blastocatellia bacterium]
MAGSDAPELFLVYGFALHRELQALAETGLSNYAVLAAATRNPAEFLQVASTRSARLNAANAPTWYCLPQTRSTTLPTPKNARA